MIIFRCILISGFLAITYEADLSNNPSNLSVNLYAEYSYQSIELVCNIKNPQSKTFITYLKCPLGTDGPFCYINCDPICSTNNCYPMVSKCSKTDINDNQKQIKWTIDATKINITGKWQCVVANQNSEEIIVQKLITSSPKNNLTKISEIFTLSTLKTTSQKVVKIPELTLTTPKFEPETQPIYHETPSEFWVFITNPNVVLILVSVFTASLLFNIIFLIRCALLRSLIDQYIQSNKISDSCLYKCFCIRIGDGLPQFIPKPNSGNAFVGYHREDVYDDMSASSQADRHLISNYSQYELEQDTLLARKIWNSSEGSQSILARQSQLLYAAQPKSNYVIVSGPVCNNRNHGPFITPSNTSFLTSSQRTCVTDESGRPSSNEYVCNESLIYSQPMKNRPKSFGQFTEGDIMKTVESCPPAPPIRTCTDTQCFRSSTPCTENMQQSINMKNVDLIEHCAHSGVVNNPQENTA